MAVIWHWVVVGLAVVGGFTLLNAVGWGVLLYVTREKPRETKEAKVVTCVLCGERLDGTGTDMAADMLTAAEHLRLLHPDQYGEGPETWPDGTVVIYDESLEPRDFG